MRIIASHHPWAVTPPRGARSVEYDHRRRQARSATIMAIAAGGGEHVGNTLHNPDWSAALR
jgi:hypothetical protein